MSKREQREGAREGEGGEREREERGRKGGRRRREGRRDITLKGSKEHGAWRRSEEWADRR